MDIKNFINNVCKEIKYKPVKEGIAEELQLHIQEIKEEYVNNGMQDSVAEEKAVSQMGEAEEIGKKLNKIHKPKLDWKLVILIAILMSFSLINSVLKETTTNDKYIIKTIFYMVISIALGIGIYFFNYKKLKKYSNVIYLIATAIMILPIIKSVTLINGIYYDNIAGIRFMPSMVAVPIYIIAFIGYLVSYNKNNIINIKTEEKELNINKDFVKILILSIVSVILIFVHSVANAIILSFVYLVIATVKILQEEEKRGKKLAVIYGTISVFIIFFLIFIVSTPYRFTKIIASFKPEDYAQGAGYTGMLQKEVIQNAKFIGEAETEVISSNDYIIGKDSIFTFIYLVGKTGILVSGILVITIILTSVKLIFNAKNIKEQYGKFLIIGLSSLYIFQSILCILMNLNLGIKADVNLPFVTYGAVYFLVNALSIAIILSVYRRKDIDVYENSNK